MNVNIIVISSIIINAMNIAQIIMVSMVITFVPQHVLLTSMIMELWNVQNKMINVQTDYIYIILIQRYVLSRINAQMAKLCLEFVKRTRMDQWLNKLQQV